MNDVLKALQRNGTWKQLSPPMLYIRAEKSLLITPNIVEIVDYSEVTKAGLPGFTYFARKVVSIREPIPEEAWQKSRLDTLLAGFEPTNRQNEVEQAIRDEAERWKAALNLAEAANSTISDTSFRNHQHIEGCLRTQLARCENDHWLSDEVTEMLLLPDATADVQFVMVANMWLVSEDNPGLLAVTSAILRFDRQT